MILDLAEYLSLPPAMRVRVDRKREYRLKRNRIDRPSRFAEVMRDFWTLYYAQHPEELP
jgi:hypothetical protein